jgi:hypothetical protein
MSAGPIQQARDARTVPAVSTSDTQRVCALVKKTKAAYCGRTSAKDRTADWESVTCADCRAAGRADGLTVPEEITKTRRGA